VLPEAMLTGERLAATIRDLLAAPQRLKEMGERARTLARPDAARQIAELVVQIARGDRP